MKTAAEFLDQGNFNNTTDMMIEFAKLHREAILKEASEKAVIKRILYEDEIVDKQSILNAYPESNIK